MKSLKDQTISGISWSFLDNAYTQIITFVVGIILARLLEPREFGLIGMLAIFIGLSKTFVDSGFSQALIRKKNCTDEDYNTVFYFNIFVSILFYLILFLTSGLISSFFDQKELINIIKVLGLSIIINGFGVVQIAQLTKEIDIKTQTKIFAIANTMSGIIAIYMAYIGFGVWSLVWRTLSNNFLRVLFLWIWHKWRPKLVFSLHSFKELFSFGSKLLASGLLHTTFENIYYLVIGKYFSAQELGYYTRSVSFANLPSANVNNVIQRVSYPVLAKLQDDSIALKNGFKKLIKNTMFLTFFFMLFMAAAAKSIILTLIGIKWLPSVIFLQLLSFSLMLYPLHALNLNILNVLGRSDLFLKLEVIKKVLVVPVILIGIFWGIIPMIIGMIIHSFICYYLNSWYSDKMIKYSFYEQIKDILPSFLLSFFIGGVVYLIGINLNNTPVIILVIQLIVGTSILIGISEIVKIEPYLEIKEIIFTKFIKRN